MDTHFKLPRLYVTHDLTENAVVGLSKDQGHYLKNVLRRNSGDHLRLFNGRDGEWLAALETLDKKGAGAALKEQLHKQPEANRRVHLLFAPIKKARQDWLIEKVVELGATDLHPVLTQNTEVRKINESRLESQILEAAEQCERFTLPTLHPLENVTKTLESWPSNIPLYACLERYDAPPIAAHSGDIAILVGPEGGFTAEEKERLASHAGCHPISLGDQVLRCETAAVKALILFT